MFGMRVLRKRVRALPPVPRPGEVRVGFPGGKAPGDIIDIATWNHFGTRTIPERPFLDNAMRYNRRSYKAAMQSSARAILLGDLTMTAALNRLGLKAVGDIQREIVELKSPPNSPETIRQKKSSNPLIADGTMRRAVTFEVR